MFNQTKFLILIKDPSKIDLIAKCDNRHLSLRKQKIDEYLLSKRSLCFDPESKYKINLFDLNIPIENRVDINFYSENVN